jgi:hypothetical protein
MLATKPLPLFVTVNVYFGSRLKVAVQVESTFSVKVLPQLAGAQPVNTEPLAALAIGETLVPAG